MSDYNWGFILYISVYLLILFIIIEIMHYNLRITKKVWKQFAEANNLELKPGGIFSPPNITGKYKGYDYTLCLVSRGSRKRKSKYTDIKITLPSQANCDFHIYREDFLFDKIGKAMGSQDIETGDKEFDRAFMIKGNIPELVKKLLTPVMREKMLAKKNLINIKTTGKDILFQKSGYMKNLDDIAHISDIMCDMGKNLQMIG